MQAISLWLAAAIVILTGWAIVILPLPWSPASSASATLRPPALL